MPNKAKLSCAHNWESASQYAEVVTHTACYEQVRKLASETDSPLYWQDVDKLNRQDDWAAAQLFSASFLCYAILQNGDTNPGLSGTSLLSGSSLMPTKMARSHI